MTMNEDGQRLFAGVLPLDDVESGAIELAGRLAEFIARLRRAVDALQPAACASPEWARALAEAADALTDAPAREAWQRAELQRLLDDVVREAAGYEGDARAARGPRAARRAPAGPPDARELPHRPPDDLHARADALGAAPGRRACSGSTTARSRARRRATATT